MKCGIEHICFLQFVQLCLCIFKLVVNTAKYTKHEISYFILFEIAMNSFVFQFACICFFTFSVHLLIPGLVFYIHCILSNTYNKTL